MRPKKSFGQHWLKSEKALNQIVATAELGENDTVLEIGGGTGILTKRLLNEAGRVIVVEVDRDLCQGLVQKFREADHFLLLQEDFLKLDLAETLTAFPGFGYPNKVVANIPYNITGLILTKLLGTITQPNPQPYDSIVLLVQKEIAERVCADPGSKIFGALSVRVQYLADCEIVCPVPAKAFYPRPQVDSAVIRLRPRQYPDVVENPKHLETLVKLGFANKRKMLRNNLKSLLGSEELTAILEKMGINPQARAEDLGVSDWVRLSRELKF
jgi:16S rRNA (adenine1518-N6/adenine1519-N6)-dimethyltransferase